MCKISSVIIVTIILIVIKRVQVGQSSCSYCTISCFETINIDTYLSIEQINYNQHIICLKIIYLNDSKIKKLAKKVFHNLRTTEELNLANNKIEYLDKEMCSDLTVLKKFNLNNNSITTLDPKLFEQLGNLVELSLNDNKIVQIDHHLFMFNTKLKILNLQNNKITDLKKDTFENNIHITSLDFRGNQIATIENGIFANLINLEILILYKNNISNLEKGAFVNNIKLHTLYLHNNKIMSIEDGIFTSLINLQIISLSDNYIKEISNLAFAKNINLTHVSVSKNQLEYLDATIFDGSTSLTLQLHDNPWNCNCKLKALISLISSENVKEQNVHSSCAKPCRLKQMVFSNSYFDQNYISIDILSKEVYVNDENITLNCEICYEANAQINWLYNGVVLGQENLKYNITNSTLNNITISTNLTINGIGKNDNGTYICRVTYGMDMQEENEFYISLIQKKQPAGETWIIWMINLLIFCVLIIFAASGLICLRWKALHIKKNDSFEIVNQENELYISS